MNSVKCNFLVCVTMFWSKQTFQAQDIPDLTNKVAIVTRSTGGVRCSDLLPRDLDSLYIYNRAIVDWQGFCAEVGAQKLYSVSTKLSDSYFTLY